MALSSTRHGSRAVRPFAVAATVLVVMVLFVSLTLMSENSRSFTSGHSLVKRQDPKQGNDTSSASAAPDRAKGAAASSSSGVAPSPSDIPSASPSPSSQPPPSQVAPTTTTTTSSSTTTTETTSTSSPLPSSRPPQRVATPSTTPSVATSPSVVAQVVSSSSSSFTPPVPATTLVVPPSFPPVSTSTESPAPTGAAAAGASSGDGFWSNKGAVGATFGAVGLIGVGVLGFITIAMLRRQRQRNAQARETIVWSDKMPEPYLRDGSPDPGFEEMANQTPMNPYSSRDPFMNSSGGLLPPMGGGYDFGDRESYYSQNNAGFGAGGLPPPEPAYGPGTGLAPPSNLAAGSHSSMDSFYGAYSHPHNGATGQAM